MSRRGGGCRKEATKNADVMLMGRGEGTGIGREELPI